MVGAVERVEKEEQPETEHGQEVAVDRPSRCRRNHIIDDRQREGSDVKPDRVMDPESAERGTACTGKELRHEVSHGVREGGEHQRADHIPAGYVDIFDAVPEEARQELDDRQHECQHYEDIHDHREFRPFEGLAEARQDQCPARNHDGKIPDAKEPAAQPVAGDRATGQHRHRMIKKGKEGVAEPAEKNALGMVVTQASPCECGNAAA